MVQHQALRMRDPENHQATIEERSSNRRRRLNCAATLPVLYKSLDASPAQSKHFEWSMRLSWRDLASPPPMRPLHRTMTPAPQSRRPRRLLAKATASHDRQSASVAKWVEQTLAGMSLRQKLGQMLMVECVGRFAPANSAEKEKILAEVQRNHVGGIIIGTDRGPLGIVRSQLFPTAILINELQHLARIPLVVGADFESGTRMRIDEGTPFPSAMAIGATGDPSLAYQAGRITALEARAAGVTWIFAPDTDLNNNPDNPIINVRSFGEDPQRVSEFVAQFVRGVEDHGALATAKHFPGHGNVTVDSHLALPTVEGTLAALQKNELVPFRAAIDAGVSSIMPGHLAVPALESAGDTPATISRAILTGLLRDEMKFRGLIVSDALDMGGVTSLFPPGEIAVRAVLAGVDVLLMPPAPAAAIVSLEAAVQSGRIAEKRIDASVRRILAAKATLGLHRSRAIDVAKLSHDFTRPEYLAQSQAIADRGVTLLRDARRPRLVPLDSTHPLRVLLVALSADSDSCPAEAFEADIRPRVDSLTVLRADSRFSRVDQLRLPPAATYDVAIAALFVRVADRKGNVGFPEDRRVFVNELLSTGKPAAIVSFGSPYLIERFPDAPTWLAAFATNDVAQRAAARALFGEISIGGKIPVTVPGVAQRGDGLSSSAVPMTLAPASRALDSRLAPAYELLHRAVADDAFPGGVLAVGHHADIAIHSFGRLTYDSKTKAAKLARVTTDTIYDVASLTKPIVTTTAVMMLVEDDSLDLDAPVSRYLPEFAAASNNDPDPAWRERVTIRHLLLHSSGLAAHRDFYMRFNKPAGPGASARNTSGVLARVMSEPLVREPGAQIEYSDLGFILLGAIVERVSGSSLDAFASAHIFAPLGMASSFFNPPARLRARIAPTEHDRAFRRRTIHAEVHDENAWAMGGVAGHAGLFSTAGDVGIFAQMMLNGGIYAHRRILLRAAIREFTERQEIGASAHALGWDVPVAPSSSGSHFSPRSFGHLGFTGTSLWIDPDRELFVVLLTNRVHPTRDNDQIRRVRPALHDAIAESLRAATPVVASSLTESSGVDSPRAEALSESAGTESARTGASRTESSRISSSRTASSRTAFSRTALPFVPDRGG
jgi:beta-N-acetylhexosaminidase